MQTLLHTEKCEQTWMQTTSDRLSSRQIQGMRLQKD